MQKNIYQVKKEEKGRGNAHFVKPGSSLNISSDCIPSDEAFSAVVDDLINDIIIDFCFQLHPATKVGIFRPDEDATGEKESEDIFGQVRGKLKLERINCPYCSKKMDPTRFANHVENCFMGNGRQSGRNAKKSNPVDYSKFADSEDDDDDDDEENQSDFSFNTSGRKKVARKKNTKNTARKKVNRDALSENNENVLNQTGQADMKEFLSSRCGVKSKKTKSMCLNNKKCVKHTQKQRDEIRNLYNVGTAGPNPCKTSDDVQIDVDTVDGETSGIYINQDISGHSTPEIIHEDSD